MILMNTGKSLIEIPYGLAVRIPGFHPGGPGSTPGMGKMIVVFTIIFNNNNNIIIIMTMVMIMTMIKINYQDTSLISI